MSCLLVLIVNGSFIDAVGSKRERLAQVQMQRAASSDYNIPHSISMRVHGLPELPELSKPRPRFPWSVSNPRPRFPWPLLPLLSKSCAWLLPPMAPLALFLIWTNRTPSSQQTKCVISFTQNKVCQRKSRQ